jgi:hypothetical protein
MKASPDLECKAGERFAARRGQFNNHQPWSNGAGTLWMLGCRSSSLPDCSFRPGIQIRTKYPSKSVGLPMDFLRISSGGMQFVLLLFRQMISEKRYAEPQTYSRSGCR